MSVEPRLVGQSGLPSTPVAPLVCDARAATPSQPPHLEPRPLAPATLPPSSPESSSPKPASLAPQREGASKVASDSARLWGIEAMRLLSAFGVIFRHVGLVVDSQTTVWGNAVQVCFKFGVQFFLITALFFAARRELRRLATPSTDSKTPDDTFTGFARTRFERVMIPFVCWGAIYIGARTFQLWRAGDEAGLREQFSDPGRLLLSGGAMMLYFLPQLWIGLLLLRAISKWVAKWSQAVLLAVFALGVAAGFALDMTANSYDLATSAGFGGLGRALETSTGFNPNAFLPTRLLLAVLAHAARALPLIALAFLTVRLLAPAPSSAQPQTSATPGAPTRDAATAQALSTRPNSPNARLSPRSSASRTPAPLSRWLAWGALGWALTLLHPWASPTLSTLSTLGGCGAFFAALWVSNLKVSFKFPVGLGRLAFGTFLCHQITLYALAFTVGRVIPKPVGPAVLFVLALTAMLLSLGVTALAARTRLGRQIFAVA